MATPPVEFLQKIVDGDSLEYSIEDKMEAAKALLPYTAKKIIQEFSNVNKTQFEVGSKQLALLDDDELDTFIRLIRKIEAGNEGPVSAHPGTGEGVPEVQ